eukprot:TRINITY_DN18932_c0_g1_i2.p1 TRINITY_DN18932_c0_g1~~TRINITY_DN18932_c0_g1_i2.p1  ORF type:complete len:254 (-),score=39.38 TRINITY_DN18932_c0_g1_i2:416-1177(-)
MAVITQHTNHSDVCLLPADLLFSASTTPGTSPRECRSPSAGMGNLIVKRTFLDLDDEHSLHDRFIQLRKCKSDASPELCAKPAVYEPGKFSDGVQAALLRQEIDETISLVSQSRRLEPHVWDEHTTVMLKNIPNNYTRDMVMHLLDEKGFAGLYDFAYLPFDFERKANLGYAFVNLVRGDVVPSFWKVFSNFSDWAIPSGLQSHIDRFRNSQVMHKSVPEQYKPVILLDGMRQQFPGPTKRIKPPHKASFHRS